MSHYFETAPSVRSAERPVRVRVPGAEFDLVTDRGVFSHGQLDAGTAVLLRAAPAPPPSGTFLDLGCGTGPIAITLARRAPDATVWAVDVNERARALTTTNARAAGVANVLVSDPDDVPGEVRFDLIWSNPPIRIGKAALHDLLATWLARLTPDGSAVLVVHKHLGADSLQRWLTDQGHPTERLTSSKGYRVLRVGAGAGVSAGADRPRS